MQVLRAQRYLFNHWTVVYLSLHAAIPTQGKLWNFFSQLNVHWEYNSTRFTTK
jgi:hypothetical protein